MNLSVLSQTAILALLCRVVESGKKNPVFSDPMAVLCLDRLMSIASAEEKERITKWRKRYAGNPLDARERALTAKRFDTIAGLFIADHPGCTVINLACGFDTRFWRIENEKCKYIELDLPEVIELKRELLKDQLDYELIGCSVLNPAWIDQATSNGNGNFLLLAEALVYYLPGQEVTRLLEVIARKFTRSQLVLDMAPEKFTKGLWKKIFQLHSRAWEIDVSFVSGIKDPRDIESYGKGLKVTGVAKGNVGPIITVSINAE